MKLLESIDSSCPQVVKLIAPKFWQLGMVRMQDQRKIRRRRNTRIAEAFSTVHCILYVVRVKKLMQTSCLSWFSISENETAKLTSQQFEVCLLDCCCRRDYANRTEFVSSSHNNNNEIILG